MPNIVTTATRASASVLTRGALSFGDVWAYVSKKTGQARAKEFIQIGNSADRMYSVRISDGALSSSPVSKSNRQVARVGNAVLRIRYFADAKDNHADFRQQLRVGDVYQVNKGGAKYMHLGDLTDGRFFAVNVDSLDFATTANSEKRVVVVGVGRFEATRVK